MDQVELNAKGARESAHAGPLKTNGIAATFLTALLADIKAVKEVGGDDQPQDERRAQADDPDGGGSRVA